MEKKKSSALSRLLGYAGKYKKLTYFSLVLSVLSTVLGLMPFVYIWKIIKEVIEVQPDFSRAAGITRNGWLAVWFALAAMLVNFTALMCSHLSAFRIVSNLRKAMLSHIARLPIGFADKTGSGKIRRTVTETAASAETLLAHNLPDMAGALTAPAAMLVMLFIYDRRFGLVCLVPVILGFAAMMKMAGPSMKDDMEKYQNALENMSNEAVEYIRGIPVVKTFGQSVFSFKKFKKAIDDYCNFCIGYTVSARLPMMLFTVFINSAFAFILCLALFLTKRAGYDRDILLGFLFYVIFTPSIVTAMNKVMFMSENTMLINDAMERTDELLNTAPLSMPKSVRQADGSTVEFKNVTYSYNKNSQPAVRNVSLIAKSGQITALVGSSGSGKTTAAGLIPRFFDPDEGAVFIGGTDVRSISKEALMNTVSYVFQDSRLLKRSIADNLRIAKPDAADAEILDSLTRARCGDIVERLPNGINSVLGSKGTYLSGGEQQRIAIARAMLKNADIVILDEASAFADPECEAEVQKAFAEMAKNKTVIMIAHRLSTIKNADKIYVLKDGKIAENGRHSELIEKNGLYADMWTEYQKSAGWKVGGNI